MKVNLDGLGAGLKNKVAVLEPAKGLPVRAIAIVMNVAVGRIGGDVIACNRAGIILVHGVGSDRPPKNS